MLVLTARGWMQCRLATDPDPSDELRGVTGWTFALPGEPDLDRVLRFQPEGTWPRRFGPAIGVRVTDVHVLGHSIPRHPLRNATVELLDNPVFEGRNGIAARERNEPMVPFHLRVQGGGITLRRAHTDAAGAPLPAAAAGFERRAEQLRVAAGVAEPRSHLTERRMNVARALTSATDDVERLALERRLQALDEAAGRPAELALEWAMCYRIPLDSADWEAADPDGRLIIPVSGDPWQVDMRIGVWDADALCGFVELQLAVAITPPADRRAAVLRLLGQRPRHR